MALPLLRRDLEEVLQATQSLWRRPERIHLFLTGGTGFFGKWLQETFAFANRELELNARLTVLTRDSAAAERDLPHLANAGIEYVQGDVRSIGSHHGNFTHLIHAATPTSQLWQPDTNSGNVSIDGTKAVLELAALNPGSRLLHCSSGAVYHAMNLTDVAPMENDLLDDERGTERSFYADGKIASEKLVLASSVDFCIARCFAFLGPHLPMDGSFAAGQFLKSALAGERIVIKGTGRDERSYMYPTDLAIWLWTILFAAPPKSIFNVGSPRPTTIRELAETVTAEFGLPPPEIRGAGSVYGRYFPDVSKAERELGLKIGVGLSEAVRRTKEWAQQSPP